MDNLQERADAMPTVDTNGAKKLPFLLSFISVCVMALGYIAFWIANLALSGGGVSNSNMVVDVVKKGSKTVREMSTLAGVLVSLVYTVVLAACIVAIVYAVRIYMNKGHTALSLSRISLLPKVLMAFSAFSCVDAFVVFFFTAIGNSVVGENLNYANNFELIGKVTEFWGYGGLGITSSVSGMEDSVIAVIAAVLFGLVNLAFAVFSVYVYSKICAYYRVLTNTSAGAQYDKGNKPPVIISFVFAGIYAVLAVISLIAGVWVDAIIQLATAMFAGAGAWMFMSVHNDLKKTSVD